MEASEPTLSVVMPVRNGAATIAAQLDALVAAAKPDAAWELLVVDNGSTDDTAAIARSYADRLPVRIVDASRAPGINVARNDGVAAARGKWLAFCDADDEIDGNWLRAVESALTEGHELVAGILDYRRLNTAEIRAWRGADRAAVMVMCSFLPSGHGANLAATRELVERVGGFDESFRLGGDDIDFMWRAQLRGAELWDDPSVVVHYRLRESLRAQWHQAVGYGACEPLLYMLYRPMGMRRRSLKVLVRDLWWLGTRLPFACSRARRGAWLRRCGQQLGRFKGAIACRTPWW